MKAFFVFHIGHAVWVILPGIFQVFDPTTPAHHLALCTDATALLGEHCNVRRVSTVIWPLLIFYDSPHLPPLYYCSEILSRAQEFSVFSRVNLIQNAAPLRVRE